MVNVFNIQHFSTGDGPGIRTTVFMGGCNLRCPWCHNPECFSNEKKQSVESVINKILHDIDYYKESGGGVTLSGGEPLLRFNECMTLLNECKKHDLHICIDTALSVNIPDFNDLCSLIDLFLVDLKTANPLKFSEICKGNFDVYRKNVEGLSEYGAQFIFRIPLIPKFNTDTESLTEIINFIKRFNRPVSFHPFHNMGKVKYTELGLDYTYKDVPLLTKNEISDIKKLFTENGISEINL